MRPPATVIPFLDHVAFGHILKDDFDGLTVEPKITTIELYNVVIAHPMTYQWIISTRQKYKTLPYDESVHNFSDYSKL